MAGYLPTGISTRTEYFNATLRFLARYEWLYNYPVTEILSSGLLDQLPFEWWKALRNLTVEEMNRIPRGECADAWPASLRHFVVAARRLRLAVADQPVPPGAPIPERLRHALLRGLSPKKMHEVTRLAAVVAEVCARGRVRCVVDMGCGLGYLCEVLHFVFGLRVVGLESDPGKVARAQQRHADIRRRLHLEDDGGVHYVECAVTDDTGPVARALSRELDADGAPAPFCLVGLHSCGDLTPHAVHLFHRIGQITHFVLVTCCYHKMQMDDATRCCASADGHDEEEQRSGLRRAERGLKARLALQWLQQWRAAALLGTAADPGPDSPLLDARVLRDAATLYGDEAQRAALDAELLAWLGPSGALLSDRGRPAPHHFFQFPLSRELRHLTRCGAPLLPWSGSEADDIDALADADVELGHGLEDDAELAGAAGLCGCQFLRRPLLRLAANETAVNWESRTGPGHVAHSIHLMTRAVFQVYAAANNLSLAQRGACLLHNEQLEMSPRDILANIVDRLLPSLPEEERRHHKQAVAFLYASLDPLRPLLEAVTALQTALQHVCEGLVLVDRLAALCQDVPDVGILRVADPKFSPRCYALVAEKKVCSPQRP